MAEKTTKRELSWYQIYKSEALFHHFEKMASKGWMFQEYRAPFITYTAIESTSIHFSGTYCQDASVYAPEGTDSQTKLQEIAENSGWTYVASYDKLQVYYSKEEPESPFETDPELELNIIQKACNSTMVGSILCCILGLATSILNFVHATMVDSTHIPSFLFAGACWLLIACIWGFRVISYYTWIHKAKIVAANENRFIPMSDISQYRKIFLIAYFLVFAIFTAVFMKDLIVMIVIEIIGLLLIVWLYFELVRLLKNKGFSKAKNIVITSIFLVIALLVEILLLIRAFT